MALARHSFVVILALFLFSLLLGGFSYYKYLFSVRNISPNVAQDSSLFNEEAFQKALKELEGREQRFNAADLKSYPDLFKGSAPLE